VSTADHNPSGPRVASARHGAVIHDPELASWWRKGSHFDYRGFDVFYVSEGSGPHLLLVHGYPFSSFDWKEIWPELTRRFTVIAPDMLGMGFSAKPRRYPYSVLGHADMHELLLEQLGITSCHVMAHDLGVSVVQELLARRELDERARPLPTIASVTWLNGGLFHEVYTPRLAQLLLSKTPLGAAAGHLPRPIARRILERTMSELFGTHTQPSAQQFDQFEEILGFDDGLRVSGRVGRFIVDRCVHRDRWAGAMINTAVPMRLIDGPADPNSGMHLVERYREVVPDPDVMLLGSQIGHWPQLEDPAGVLDHFRAFLDSRVLV
jgi:pimeloyl-ACP methyl ester carboxylesterase